MQSIKLLISGICGGAIAAIAVVGLQLAIDPYDYFGFPGIKGINALKPFMYENARLAKPIVIAREKPSAIVFGGSTSESAYDPDSPYFKPYGRAYNAALPGGRFYESYRMLQHATAVSDLKLAVVALDFLNWLQIKEIEEPSFPEKHLAISYEGKRQAPSTWRALLAPRTITNGLVTLSYQDETVLMNGTKNNERFPSQWYRSNGQRTHTSSLRYGIAFRGYDGPFRSYMPVQYERIKTTDPANPFPARVDGKSYFELIDDFAALAKQKHVRLIFNLPPCHISILDTIYEAGAWGYFEAFKREVAARVKEDNRRLGTDIAIYDFCVVSKMTDAPIFDRPDQMKPVRGFWDPAHPSDALGKDVLGTMLGGRAPIGSFGTDLAREPDIEGYLARQRSSLEAIRHQMPKEFRAYNGILEKHAYSLNSEAS